MGIDPAPFWAYLYLYNCESKYVANLIRTNKLRGTGFHSTFWFIEDLCALGYGGEFSETFVEINPIKLELKVEYKWQPCNVPSFG